MAGSRAGPSRCSTGRKPPGRRGPRKVTASGKYKALDPAASDGSQTAAGVLYDAVDATAADAEGVAILRLAEVNAAELVWPAGITGGQKSTALGQLAAINIIAR